jgi:hypothetical protein
VSGGNGASRSRPPPAVTIGTFTQALAAPVFAMAILSGAILPFGQNAARNREFLAPDRFS